MLLTAGLGHRMEPLSSAVPKPALDVLGRPLLSSALANLRRAGCEDIVANLHRHPDLVAAAARSEGGGTIVFSWEPDLLGGAGGVAAARSFLGDDDVLVGNGDTWGDLDLAPLLAARADGVAVLALIPHPDPHRWSSIVLGPDGPVTRFLAPGSDDPAERFLFTGFQLLTREVVASLPAGPSEMASLWDTLRRSHRLRGAVVSGRWREAGTPASYRELVVESLGDGTWTHPSATVEGGCRIERSAVGAGCGVARGATLTGCVLMAGAFVGRDSELRDCVIAGPVTVSGEMLVGTLVVPHGRVPLG
ncbi:MAG: sugar phosphate nucleotidyltransferase [Thermoanaerobaculaceae bacterium]